MTNNINILYTCDNAYLPLTSISMASVIENNKDSFITFYLATESDNSVNFNTLKEFYNNNNNVQIKYLDCKKYDDLLSKKELDKWGSNSYYVYWKLFAYDLLDLDNIWYLDSDVICLGKIENPILDENKSLGAVLDSAHSIYNKIAHINESYYYFNTGSLFVDIKRWKRNKNIEKIIEYIRGIRYKPLMCDQDILAISLQSEIQVINPKYNYLAGYDYYGVHNSFGIYSLDKKPFYKEKDIEESRSKAVFYHCLGGVFGRPWEEGNFNPIKKDFIKYREISCWPNYSKKWNQSLLVKVQRILEILPDSVYIKIHNVMIQKYIKDLSK